MKLVITVTEVDGNVLEYAEVVLKNHTEHVLRSNLNATTCPQVTVQLAWLETVAELKIPPRCRP